MTASPIYEKKIAIDLFVGLRDGSYHLFSGRTFKAMILKYPAPSSDLESDEFSERFQAVGTLGLRRRSWVWRSAIL
ncbi:MAG: hypothetical protein WC378_01410, partial [Opitutaceae bacterium]